MGSTNGVMLRVLLNHFYQNPSDAPLRFLPQDLSKSVLSSTIYSKDPSTLLQQPAEQINGIHYSWLIPVVKQFPPIFHPSILKSLSKSQAMKLQQILHIPKTNEELAPPIRNLFINKVYTHVKPHGILPLAFLPETPLSFLATLTKEQLVELIDFLGLYDLAESIRHIIDKNFLQKLYKCLSRKQRQFLRICLHQQEKVFTAKMEMSTWNGDCKKLDLMLQRRGLLRLGKSLCGLHPDFVWHVAHRLDTGRGTILLQYFSPESTPSITARLVQQVTNLMNFLNLKSKT